MTEWGGQGRRARLLPMFLKRKDEKERAAAGQEGHSKTGLGFSQLAGPIRQGPIARGTRLPGQFLGIACCSKGAGSTI